MPNENEEVTLMGKKGYKADLVLTINGVNNVFYTMYFIPYDSENLITKVSSYSMPYPKHFRKLYSFHFHCTLLLP